jgi:hypothetical protein
MKNFVSTTLMLFVLSMTLLVGCNDDSRDTDPAALSDTKINLIFVVSPDLEFQTAGDVQPDTANLTTQGLNRSLQMATYLKKNVLGSKNVTSIYALSPMTHLQTEKSYPDMAAIGYIQPFALINQTTLLVSPPPEPEYTANSFPIKVSYVKGSVPNDVSVPSSFCPNCAGIDFNNHENNDTLVTNIINANENSLGFHVFSAPWETVSAMMTYINEQYGYNLKLPAKYNGSNYVYAISIPTNGDGDASLTVYNSHLKPSTTYPALPEEVKRSECTHTFQPYFKSTRKNGENNSSVPSNANTNETVYIVRHAEAHPNKNFKFEDGNFVAAGQWRALALRHVFMDKVSPDMVYSIDPAQWFHTYGEFNFSYVRPSLTILPFAIGNNLPYYLVSGFQLNEDIKNPDPTDVNVAKNTSNFFFTDGHFSNKTILLAWESGHIRPLINQLLASYGGDANLPTLDLVGPPTGGWPSADYDTIWRVTLDGSGNLSVDNELCEGIDSASLPSIAPQF